MLRSRGIDPDAELAAVHRDYAPWGAMCTLPTGHLARCPVGVKTGDRAVAWMDDYKLGAHLAAGGTLVEPRPVGPPGAKFQGGFSGG
jgi:hypothetical protein